MLNRWSRPSSGVIQGNSLLTSGKLYCRASLLSWIKNLLLWHSYIGRSFSVAHFNSELHKHNKELKMKKKIIPWKRLHSSSLLPPFNNMDFQFHSEKDNNMHYYFKYQWDVGFQKNWCSLHSIATVVCIHLQNITQIPFTKLLKDMFVLRAPEEF